MRKTGHSPKQEVLDQIRKRLCAARSSSVLRLLWANETLRRCACNLVVLFPKFVRRSPFKRMMSKTFV
jgi:hypothetical protein